MAVTTHHGEGRALSALGAEHEHHVHERQEVHGHDEVAQHLVARAVIQTFKQREEEGSEPWPMIDTRSIRAGVAMSIRWYGEEGLC